RPPVCRFIRKYCSKYRVLQVSRGLHSALSDDHSSFHDDHSSVETWHATSLHYHCRRQPGRDDDIRVETPKFGASTMHFIFIRLCGMSKISSIFVGF
ncbi:MAG: hypothetical protein LBC40_06210, partial [Dysgonamonadaceae bacterium]|nr:hypothetical protein [Dysgonamonadaceae bacterium]